MLISCAAWLLAAAPVQAAVDPGELRRRIEAYVDANQRGLVATLVELVSLPNVASDADAARANAALLRDMLGRRGFHAELLETDGNPLVYGELRVPGARRTLLLYSHYDGLPADAKAWKQASPFVPVLRDARIESGGREVPGWRTRARLDPEWRLYGRSAADAKAPIVGLLTALDALRQAGVTPTANLRVVLDGEEKSGSPSLAAAVARHRDKLAGDLMLILDGQAHPTGRPTVMYGARGWLLVDVTVFGPRLPLHSGHYGNWAPNPGMRLARLLASMKDADGRVAIAGFYDGIAAPTPEEQAMMDAVPDDPDELMRLFGFAEPERPGRTLQQALQLPSLNVRGLSSAYVGPDARSIIPDRATASIDVRLVKETKAAAMAERLRAHLGAQGYHVVESEPDDETRARHPRIAKLVLRGSTEAYRTSPLLPESRAVARAVAELSGEPPVLLRTSGGTVPIAPVIEAMGFPAVALPIVNFDDDQHAENENLRLGHLFRGVVTIAAALVMR